jgi:hypothetical protein
MDRREWFGTVYVAAAIVGIAFALLLAYRLGVVSLTQIDGYLIEGVIIGGGITIIAIAGAWGFGPRFRRWMGKRGVVDPTPPLAVQFSLPSHELSEDKKVEILERHWKDYRDRVLEPLRTQPALLARSVGTLSGDPQPWDELYVTYDPSKYVTHRSDLVNAHLGNDIGDYAKTFGKLTSDAKLLWSDANAWRDRVRRSIETVMADYAPIEHGAVGPPKEPFVSLDGSERRVARAWRDIVFPKLQAEGKLENFTPPLLGPEEAAPVREVTDGLWSCDGMTVARPPEGKSIGEWQARIAAVIAEPPTLFREYASLRRRRLDLDTSVDRLRIRMGELIAQIDRGEYQTRLSCCLERIRPIPSVIVGEPKAHLELIPREHYPGHMIPAAGSGRLQTDPHYVEGSTLQEWSDPEAKKCKGSQRWDTFDPRGEYVVTDPIGEVRRRIKEENKIFYMKLGAVEVRALGETAHDCEATLRFRTLRDPSGVSAIGEELSKGHLNWFSQEIRDSFLENWKVLRRIIRNPAYKFNRLILNQRRDIQGGKSLDLMLFYTVNNSPGIYACGEGATRRIAGFDGRKQAKFDIEITVSGRNVTAFTSVFKVTAAPDDFNIVRRDGDL